MLPAIPEARCTPEDSSFALLLLCWWLVALGKAFPSLQADAILISLAGLDGYGPAMPITPVAQEGPMILVCAREANSRTLLVQ